MKFEKKLTAMYIYAKYVLQQIRYSNTVMRQSHEMKFLKICKSSVTVHRRFRKILVDC
jgi:hypothetical protein